MATACVYMLAIGLQLVQTVEKSPNNKWTWYKPTGPSLGPLQHLTQLRTSWNWARADDRQAHQSRGEQELACFRLFVLYRRQCLPDTDGWGEIWTSSEKGRRSPGAMEGEGYWRKTRKEKLRRMKLEWEKGDCRFLQIFHVWNLLLKKSCFKTILSGAFVL